MNDSTVNNQNTIELLHKKEKQLMIAQKKCGFGYPTDPVLLGVNISDFIFLLAFFSLIMRSYYPIE